MFKRGCKGMGYYLDEVDQTISLTAALRPMYGCTPIDLKLAELIPHAAIPSVANPAAISACTADVGAGMYGGLDCKKMQAGDGTEAQADNEMQAGLAENL